MPYTARQMFDIVADVARYPEFLPWVVGARVHSRQDNVFLADLLVGFKMIRERYTSRVTLTPADGIDVTYTDGPFHHLENSWRFQDTPDGCQIDFHLDFEFKSRLLQKIIGGLFNDAVRRMVTAFHDRARHLHGPDGRPDGDPDSLPSSADQPLHP